MITPQKSYPILAKALGIKTIYLKREDLHPYGSHKGRSIPYMIDQYLATGKKSFAISSSGNAALAAALHIKSLGTDDITLDIFVGKNIDEQKLERLENVVGKSGNMRILVKERPLQALTQATQEGVISLRQSTDDMALIGYKSLAKELSEIKDLGAIFIGTSSGTTAQALAQHFLNSKMPVQVHIVQTSACHPMIDTFTICEHEKDDSLADAIVDKTALRKNVLIPLLKETGGSGWCASNEDIETAMNLVEEHADIKISPNSALSIVGVMKAGYEGYEIRGVVVCVICGQ